MPALHRAFTVVELLVAVTLMTIIVLALYGMFQQTQKALQSNITQVDVTEAGRATMDLFARELAQAVPTERGNQTNLLTESLPAVAYVQPLVMSNSFRTNFLQNLFFVQREGKTHTGIGYRVVATNGPVASLYRLQLTTNNAGELLFPRFNLCELFREWNYTNMVPVADGIVHLSFQTFDALGRPLTVPVIDAFYPPAFRRSFTEAGASRRTLAARGVWIASTTGYPPSTVVRQADTPLPVNGADARYMSNALPAYVDVELGMLEPLAVQQFRSLQANQSLATNFLSRQAGKVQLFRQRIPIRAASL